MNTMLIFHQLACRHVASMMGGETGKDEANDVLRDDPLCPLSFTLWLLPPLPTRLPATANQ
jgi:hypothetical protein